MPRTLRTRLLAPAAVLAVVAGLSASPALAAPASSAPPAPDSAAVQGAVRELSRTPSSAQERQWDAARQELAEQAPASFYALPDRASLPQRPGVLLRQEPMDFYLDPVKLIRVPASASRIMYTSTDSNGRIVPVTGTVLEPTRRWLGRGERPVISYAPGTQGVGDQCAPSKTLSTGEQYEGVGISTMLSAGYAVVVTDYAGLGPDEAPGQDEHVHTYMIRKDQAHAMLDSVRAAQHVTTASVSPASPVALAGYSQGGGAAAAAAEVAHTYGAGLDVRGAYAGAPPADLVAVADKIDGTMYASFLLFAMAGATEAYDLDPASYLNETGVAALATASESCTGGLGDQAGLKSSTLTRDGQSFSTLVRTDPLWGSIVAEQRLGAPGRAPEIPVMIAHSLTDDVIPYAVGRDLGRRWCAQGSRVRFDPVLTPTHLGGYVASLPRAMGFLDAALKDRWTPNSCGWF